MPLINEGEVTVGCRDNSRHRARMSERVAAFGSNRPPYLLDRGPGKLGKRMSRESGWRFRNGRQGRLPLRSEIRVATGLRACWIGDREKLGKGVCSESGWRSRNGRQGRLPLLEHRAARKKKPRARER